MTDVPEWLQWATYDSIGRGRATETLQAGQPLWTSKGLAAKKGKGSGSWAEQDGVPDSNQTSIWSPGFLHPPARLFRTLCFFQDATFCQEGALQRWNSPQVFSTQDPAYDLNTLFPGPPSGPALPHPQVSPSAKLPARTLLKMPATTPSHYKSHLGDKSYCPYAGRTLLSPCEGLPAVLLPAEALTNTQTARGDCAPQSGKSSGICSVTSLGVTSLPGTRDRKFWLWRDQDEGE